MNGLRENCSGYQRLCQKLMCRECSVFNPCREKYRRAWSEEDCTFYGQALKNKVPDAIEKEVYFMNSNMNSNMSSNTSSNSSSGRSKQALVPEAREALNKFKMEAASEVGVNLKQGYNGHLTSREAGSVGGQMSRT